MISGTVAVLMMVAVVVMVMVMTNLFATLVMGRRTQAPVVREFPEVSVFSERVVHLVHNTEPRVVITGCHVSRCTGRE